ncbi:hypothetical protein ACHAXM_002903 [Skeletonema potamos]
MKIKEGKHPRRSVAALVAVATSLVSHSVATSAAAGRSLELQHSNSANLRRRRPSELSQIQMQHRQIESINSECKGSSLNPGDILHRNEFICHGQLRLGIDYRGRFILGFAANDTDTTPETIAWQAKPTTLFVDPDRPFEFVRLTDDGNILGFDQFYTEIYDSNYDNQNREQGKEDGSILVPSDDCLQAESVQSGTLCVTLSSQPKPGMPNGMTTWGVKVDTDTMISFEPPSSSPTSAPTLQPSQYMTTSSPSEESTGTLSSTDSSNSTFEPITTGIPSSSFSPTIAPSEGSIQIGSQANNTIIYGYVWLDENRDGKMGRGETRFPDFEVKFYECLDNGRVSAAGSVKTDLEGLYFIQLPYGEYRALYEVDQDVYGYSVGVQDSTSGWTDCMSSSKTVILSSVGLYSKDDVPSTLADVPPSTESNIFSDVPGSPPAAEAADSLSQVEVAATEGEEVKMSSIAGFIYIDTNKNKEMDSGERSIAVKGYTIGDAIVKVSLIDCQPDNSVLPSVSFVPFPGHYMFSNLSEGSYKLKFELISVDPNATMTSMYSFFDETNTVSASKESQCGKLGQGQDNDQGDVGVQPVEVTPRQGVMDPESAPADFEVGSEAMNTGRLSENGGDGSNVSGIIGGFVAACVLAAGAAIFVLRKRQPISILSRKQGHKDRNENRGNLGSSMDGDMSTTTSYTSLSHQNELVDREGYEVQYEKNSQAQSDSDSESSAEESGNVISSGSSSQRSLESISRSNPRDNIDTSSWKKEAIPENATVVYDSHQMRESNSSPHVDDNKSVVSSGSDQSSDPPGASYKDTPFDRFPAPHPRDEGNRGSSVPPPPPRKFPSPQQQRYISPQQQRRMSPQQQRYVSPQQQRRISPQQQRISPSQNPSPHDLMEYPR